MAAEAFSSVGKGIPMEEMAISRFKATCLAVMDRVRKTRKPIRITRFGEPVAEVVPPRPRKKRKAGSVA